MFNNNQQQIYEDTWGFIEEKLNFYVSKILEISDEQKIQPALNALYFCLDTALKLDKQTQDLIYRSRLNAGNIDMVKSNIEENKARLEAVTQFFFPAESHHQIRGFFSKLHDFMYGQDEEHRMVASVIDSRFFASQNKEEQQMKQKQLLHQFGEKLNRNCFVWLRDQQKRQRFDKEDIPKIEQRLIEKGILDAREEVEQATVSSKADKWSQFRSSP